MRIEPQKIDPNLHDEKWFRERSCLTKVRYELRRDAKKITKKSLLTYGRKMSIYPCRFCGGFHITKEDSWSKTKAS